jgi:lipopolysaccharide transport system permease protein
MQRFPASPIEMAMSVWRNRSLIFEMTKREVLGRYRGSVLGLGWSLFHPLVMLGIYTFVFSIVFRARWPDMTGNSGTLDFALALFVGMILHSLFSECVNRAPTLITSNVNYVKKVVFPLEILPWVALGSAVFHGVISLAVLLLILVVTHGTTPLTVLLIPLVILPLLSVTLGVAWFLSALGVYLRDMGQIIGIITSIMLFLSPVFYPASAVPAAFRPLIYMNPLTFIIEQARDVVFVGRLPSWSGLLMYALGSLFIAWAGFAWFQKTRKGFADVV